MQSTTIVEDTNATLYNAIKITRVIFVMEFDFHSLNDTVSGQWWWQLITLLCQQQFLGIWAAVLQSILACSSSGEKKEQPRWEFCASVAIERWGNKLLNLSNHTLPEEFLKWGWSKTLKFEPLAHGPGFNIWWDSLLWELNTSVFWLQSPPLKVPTSVHFHGRTSMGLKSQFTPVNSPVTRFH